MIARHSNKKNKKEVQFHRMWIWDIYQRSGEKEMGFLRSQLWDHKQKQNDRKGKAINSKVTEI